MENYEMRVKSDFKVLNVVLFGIFLLSKHDHRPSVEFWQTDGFNFSTTVWERLRPTQPSIILNLDTGFGSAHKTPPKSHLPNLNQKARDWQKHPANTIHPISSASELNQASFWCRNLNITSKAANEWRLNQQQLWCLGKTQPMKPSHI